MPRRISAASIFPVSWSSSQIVPDVGSIIRLTMRSVVVLPQPEGPTRTVIRPVGASSVRWSTAVVPPAYCFETSSKRIMASTLGETGDNCASASGFRPITVRYTSVLWKFRKLRLAVGPRWPW